MAKVNRAAAVRMELDEVPERYRDDVQSKLDPWDD